MSAKDFLIENGVLMKYKGTDKNIVIPEGVQSIASDVFQGRRSLQSIIIPEGVKVIERCLFERCIGLEQVVIPKGVVRIDERAFEGCKSLTSIIIPEGVTEIGLRAFFNCIRLERIILPASLLLIGMDAFEHCDSIHVFQNPLLPLIQCQPTVKQALARGFCNDPSAFSDERKAEYVKYLVSQKKKLLTTAVSENDVSVFIAYDQLEIILSPVLRDELIKQAIHLDKKDVLAFLMDYKNRTANLKKEEKEKERFEEQLLTNPYMAKILKADWKWSKLEDGTLQIDKYRGKDTNVIIPPFVGKAPITSIGNNAFRGCCDLTTITIPDSVTSIGAKAFYGCESLESIILPSGITSIGREAFRECFSLTSIALPDSLISIGEGAFDECENLKSIRIPDNVTSIGTDAFFNCDSLMLIELPAHLTLDPDWCLPDEVTVKISSSQE